MPRTAHDYVSVTFKLHPDDRAWLDAEAAARGIDRSECLRRFIRANRGAQHYDQTAPRRAAKPPAAGMHPFVPHGLSPLRCKTCGRTARYHG